MTAENLKKFYLSLRSGVSTVVLSTAMIAASQSAMAQDAGTTDDEEGVIEQVLVTGSRIRRDTFSSAAPMQVITTGDAMSLGITSITDMLQQTTIANGRQIDASINTNSGNSNASEAPPAGGVGSANIDLRGLGPERTLILLNGRRLGASGVRGAPSQPDLNLLPFAMVERVEVITEGASSIYGADAVAGVVNVILKSDFEGFEVSGNYADPKGPGGTSKGFSLLTGASGDRSRFTLAAEFFERDRVRTGDKQPCLRMMEEDAEGNLYSICRSGFFDNVALTTSDGWILATPGTTNIGIPGFSDGSAAPLPASPGRDRNLDGAAWRNFGFTDYYNDQDDRRNADYIQPVTRFSVVANGSYDLDWWGNEEFYTEFYYLNRHQTSTAAREQIYATFPGMIPEEDVDGNIIVDGAGAPILADNPWNPFAGDYIPIITLDDIPQDRLVELQTIRMVGGIRGDIPAGFFGDNNWSYDAYFSYDRGTGFSSQKVLNESNFALALGTMRLDSDGNVICGISPVDIFGFFTQEECVPVNLAADSIYSDGDGRFSSDAERDFLLGNRTNRTVTEQYNAQGYMTGDLFEMPNGAGIVSAAFGYEYRKDTIASQNSRDGVVADIGAENPLPEGETIGTRSLNEVFGEINIPILQNVDGAKYLGLEAAMRYTDESNFGTATTERLRLTYQPNDWVQLSGSYGTSFRAPNMREQFLASQGGGIGGGADPCNANAFTDGAGVYDVALDDRTARVLANCIASGADPTSLGLSGTPTIPTSAGGNANLMAETSRSYTGTLTLTQPWTDEFDFSVAISYFDIKINDTVRESNPATIIADCYNNEDNLADSNCARITRNPTGEHFITNVDASFINVGLERAKGWDINTRFGANIGEVAFGWTTSTSIATSRLTRVDPTALERENVGTVTFPKLRVTSTMSADYRDLRFVFEQRYIGKGQQLERDLGDYDNNVYLIPTETRPYGKVSAKVYTNASVAYNYDDRVAFTLGAKNLFDVQPPLVGGGGIQTRMNAVVGGGYDLYGRTLFFNITAAL